MIIYVSIYICICWNSPVPILRMVQGVQVPRNWPFLVRCCCLWWRWSTPGYRTKWAILKWKKPWNVMVWLHFSRQTVVLWRNPAVGRWFVSLYIVPLFAELPIITNWCRIYSMHRTERIWEDSTGAVQRDLSQTSSVISNSMQWRRW